LKYSSYTNNTGTYVFQYIGVGSYTNCLIFFKNAGVPAATGTTTTINSDGFTSYYGTNPFGISVNTSFAVSFSGYF
jgi:hypothetical protein